MEILAAAEKLDRQRTERLLVSVLAFLFVGLVVRWGWIADDGFITARTWENLTTGHGLVLNRGWRVQSYTSPLFMALGAGVYAVVHEPYWALMLSCLLCVLGLVLAVLVRFRAEPARAGLIFLGLSGSPFVLSFSTSGLENSLAFLVTFAFASETLRRNGRGSRWLWVTAALLLLTRQDYLFLVLPVLLRTAFLERRTLLRQAWPGLLLLGGWLVFAVFYYGFLFPNTAYAKLNVSLDRQVVFMHGVTYVVDAINRDPLLAVGLFLGAGAAVSSHFSTAARLLLAGATLYVGYVVWIGGDFMAGRFFTTPYVLVAVVLATETRLSAKGQLVLGAALGLWLLPLLRQTEKDRVATHWSDDQNGIIDERAAYVEHTNLGQNLVEAKWRTHSYLKRYKQALRAEGSNVVVFPLIGMAPFVEGPTKHILEEWSLSEPLLARLRYRGTRGYRPGHYPRRLPEGYVATLRTGKNQIRDACVRRLYDRIQLAAHAPLGAPGRAAAIWQLNFVERTCPMP